MLNVIRVKGDVLVPKSYLLKCDADRNVFVVHGCNAQGVMGSGLAKQVKFKFPPAYKAYKEHEEHAGMNMLGDISMSPIMNDGRDFGHFRIINAVTQQNYGTNKNVRYTSYDAVDATFAKIKRTLRGMAVRSAVIAIPHKFASDRGNADWGVVKDLIKNQLKDTYLTLYIVEHDV